MRARMGNIAIFGGCETISLANCRRSSRCHLIWPGRSSRVSITFINHNRCVQFHNEIHLFLFICTLCSLSPSIHQRLNDLKASRCKPIRTAKVQRPTRDHTFKPFCPSGNLYTHARWNVYGITIRNKSYNT